MVYSSLQPDINPTNLCSLQTLVDMLTFKNRINFIVNIQKQDKFHAKLN